MKPLEHAKNSAKRYGGIWEDYIAIHDWFDQSKAHVPDIRHRSALHHSFGIYLCEQQFGTAITNSIGNLVSVRSIGEDHVVEDLGYIPTLQDWLSLIPLGAAAQLTKPRSTRVKIPD